MPKVDPNTQRPVIPEAFNFLFENARYKVGYGGRGKGATWSFARALVYKAHVTKKRILCTRQIQNTIADSVKRVLDDQINELGLRQYFKSTQSSIISEISGSEFLFKGIGTAVAEMKSTEAIDICWVAEAQTSTLDAWRILPPTIRAPGSEIWVDYNPENESDPVHQRFVVKGRKGAIVRHINYDQNPFFPAELEEERLADYQRILDAPDDDERQEMQAEYDNIWLGACRKISRAAIFGSRIVVHDFDTPQGTRFYFGADFGFADDPATLIRFWVTRNEDKSEELWIDWEAYDHHVELDDMPAFYAGGLSDDRKRQYPGVPDARRWPIKADNARPETISYLLRKGFNIAAAKKWSGSVEDGITHIKGYKLIHIHRRCPNTAREARLYSYKVDKQTKEILPIVVDAHNHAWDAVRYGLDGIISSRGGVGLWERLAEV